MITEQPDRRNTVSVNSIGNSTKDLATFYTCGGALKLWDDKEAWKIRASVEDGFYVKYLQQKNTFKILDIAAASGYHAIQLSLAGFSVTATDGLQEFVDAGLSNQREARTFFPFSRVLWSDLHPALFNHEKFDAVLCLGGSLHHTELSGVQEIFANVARLLRPGGIFLIEQRNYERFFRDKPSLIPHPCGWTYHVEYEDPRTIVFTVKDSTRLVDARCACTVTFEHELYSIASETGFIIKDLFFDYGKCSVKENASWIQYAFEVPPSDPLMSEAPHDTQHLR
jgi:SAM-dependent methyltransferase